jgi:hypothetical protein
MNTTTKIAISVGTQLATMLAGAIVLITVAEAVNWWCFLRGGKNG